jgi:ketosteroid isomerase-like protein
MKKSLSAPVGCLAIIILLLTLRAQPALAATRADEQTFITLQRDWAKARKNADMQFLDRFYAREFTVGVMNGAESSRAQDLAMFSSGDLKPSVIEDKDMHVYIYGETAMVTGLEHLEGSYKGRTGQFDLRFTNVFVYRDDRWQMVRHQAAQIRNE